MIGRDNSREICIPVKYRDEMEPFVPEETSRKEWAGWNAGEQLVRPFRFLVPSCAGFGCVFPKAFIFFLVLRRIRSIDDGVSIKVTNAPHQVREHGLRKSFIFGTLERFGGREDLGEPFLERAGGGGDGF